MLSFTFYHPAPFSGLGATWHSFIRAEFTKFKAGSCFFNRTWHSQKFPNLIQKFDHSRIVALTRASERTDLKLRNLCDGDSRPQADALPDGDADLGVAEDQHLES